MALNILRTSRCFKDAISPVRKQYFLEFQEKRTIVVTQVTLHYQMIAVGLPVNYAEERHTKTSSPKHAQNDFLLSKTKLMFEKNVLLSRKYSNTTSVEQETNKLGKRENDIEDKFEEFFRENKIIYLKTVSNLKLYNLIATVILLPTSFFFIGPEAGQFCVNVAIPTTLLLFGVAQLSTKVVGVLSLNDKKTKVKMSHLTFWGRRNDVYFDVQEIVPLSDVPGRRMKSISPFCTYVSKNVKYMFMNKSNMLDYSTFKEIFGSQDIMR